MRFRVGIECVIGHCSRSQDTETKLYYLQSRYYDPEMGRFISADALVSTGQGVLGNNMFAYCLNNPVVLVDTAGTAAHIGFSADGQPHYAPWKIGSPGGGGWPWRVSLSGINVSADDSLTFSEAFAILFNDDEQVVIDAEYFAFYKGQLVVKQNWAITNGRSFSFGIMFLHATETRTDVVKHEWGHYVQLWGMGLEGYIVNVAIPSVLSDGSDPYYYSNPWERTADTFGGVDRGDEYRPGSLAWGVAYYVIGWPLIPVYELFGK